MEDRLMALTSSIPDINTTEGKILTAVTVVALSWLGKKLYNAVVNRHEKPFPPGPRGLPFFGNLFDLETNPALQAYNWKGKYGNVVGLTIGSKKLVILNGLKTVRQALVYQAEAFAGRPDFYSFREVIAEGYTLAFNSYSPKWRIQKKVLVNSIKMFTQKDPPLDVTITQEAARLTDLFLSHEGKPIEPYQPILTSCLYLICGMLFGYDSKLCNDRDALVAVGGVEKTRKAEGLGKNIIDFFPMLRPFLKHNLKGLIQESKHRMGMIYNQEKQHRENGYNEEHLRDVMDGLIKAIDNLTEDEKSTGLTPQHIITNAFTLLNAGSDTLASMLYWASLYTIAFPEMQERIHEELDRVVGRDRGPSIEDRPNLHYIEAFFQETMRYCVLVPFLFHATVKDTEFQGYHIPKDTVVFPNMYSVSRDSELWANPHHFDPTRYLNENGHFDKSKTDSYLAFGAGKRRCLGEHIGRMEFILIFSTVMQKVRFEKEPGKKLDITPIFNFTALPEHFNVIPRRRY